MNSRLIQNGAALAIAALLTFIVSTAVQQSVNADRFERNVRFSQLAAPRFEQRVRVIDEAGRAALSGLALGADIGPATDFLLAEPAGAAAPTVRVEALGAAELLARDGGWKLRGVALDADAGLSETDFRRIAEGVAGSAAAANVAPHAPWIGAVAANRRAEAGRIWMMWRDPAAGRALLGLFAATPLGFPDAEAPAHAVLDLVVASADRLELASDHERAVLAARLGGRVLAIAVEGARLELAALDAVDIAPQVGAVALTALAVFLLLRAHRANVTAFNDSQQRIIRDMRAHQSALDASEARFRHLAESTNVIPWTADLEHQRFTYIGPQIESVSGYPAATWQANGFWMQHIHPGDRQRVAREIHSCAESGRFATIDYRMRGADGRIVHIRNMLSVTKKKRRRDGGERLVPVAQGFMLDITETKNAAITLELAREKAEEANRVKSEFLASMSHELRTPLNAVIGFSEIMKDQLFGELDPRYREYAANVYASGTHLLQLINDVLDLSKIEAGHIELAEEPVHIGDLLGECRTLLQERFQSAGVSEKLEIAESPPLVMIDERRIKQVILNLMSNAIKFTPPGGSVTLKCEHRAGRGVMVSVRDTGIGMNADEVPKALSKFGQIDGDLTRKHDGTGLGLPIAKSLIEMHGGEFEVESEKGRGTEMRFWLPETRITQAA